MTEDKGNELVPILWIDDQPDHVQDKNAMAIAEGIELRFDSARTIEEAIEKLETGIYCGIIADLNMSEDSDQQNGAEFLSWINEIIPWIPKFVYSGYLHDERYREPLSRANAVAVFDRSSIDWAQRFSEVPLIALLRERANEFRKVRFHQPELIPYNSYANDPNVYQKEVSEHWTKHKSWISKKLSDLGWAWGVVCGSQLVVGSPILTEYPSFDELIEIARAHNLIPFAYSRWFPPESNESELPAVWSNTDFNDLYPTLAIQLENLLLVDDFDTGAYQTHISDELVQQGMLNFVQDSSCGTHLFSPYRYFTKRVDITITSKDGRTKSASLPVCVVANWANSPFVAVNKNRKALLGRDLLRTFKMQVTLRSDTGHSLIDFD